MRCVVHRASHALTFPAPRPTTGAIELERDEEGSVWGIEIEDLDDLMALAEVEGPIRVEARSPYRDAPSLVILDDYYE